MVAPPRNPATSADLLAREDHDRLEIIGGEIVEKAVPSPNHSFAEIKLGALVDLGVRRHLDNQGLRRACG